MYVLLSPLHEISITLNQRLSRHVRIAMNPDIEPGLQEVRKTPTETATGHTGVRRQLRQLQGPQEGRGELHPLFLFDLLTSKQLIKQLSATPILQPQNAITTPSETLDPQALLQANKATFFFRLVWRDLFRIFPNKHTHTHHQERELERVNAFYLQKEAEVRSESLI